MTHRRSTCEKKKKKKKKKKQRKRSKGRLQDGTQNGQNKERRLTAEEHVGDHKTRASSSVNEETSMRQKLFASLTTGRALRTGKGVKGREGYGEVAADIHSPKSESHAGSRAVRVKGSYCRGPRCLETTCGLRLVEVQRMGMSMLQSSREEGDAVHEVDGIRCENQVKNSVTDAELTATDRSTTGVH